SVVLAFFSTMLALSSIYTLYLHDALPIFRRAGAGAVIDEGPRARSARGVVDRVRHCGDPSGHRLPVEVAVGAVRVSLHDRGVSSGAGDRRAIPPAGRGCEGPRLQACLRP